MAARPFLAGVALALLASGAALAWWVSRDRVSADEARAAVADAREESGADVELSSPAQIPTEPVPSVERRERLAVDAPSPASPEASEGEATIVVRFVARETGTRLAGMRCTARKPSDFSGNETAVDSADGGAGEIPRSGDDGIARLHVPPGDYVVKTWARGTEPRSVDALAAGEAREIVFAVITKDVDGYVLVVDAESGLPVADVRVGIGDFAREKEPIDLSPPTDGRGLVRLDLPPEYAVSGETDRRGYAPTRFAIGVGHETPDSALVVPVHEAGAIRGRIVDGSGTPIRDAVVRVRGRLAEVGAPATMLAGDRAATKTWSDRTSPAGEFEIAGLTPNAPLAVDITVEVGRLPRAQAGLRFAPGEVKDVLYEIRPGATVNGWVVDSDGKPCPRLTLWLLAGGEARTLRSWEEARDTTRSAADGSFAFEDVPPGSWLVGPAGDSDLVSWAELVVVPPGVSHVDVLLRLPRALSLAGRVLGPEDEPVAGVELIAYGPGGYRSGKSGNDGSFCLGPFGAGSLRIWVAEAPKGYASGFLEQEVVAGDEDVVMRLHRGGALLVRVHADPAEAEVLVSSAASVGMMVTSVDADGTCRIEDLPAGLYSVLARAADGAVGLAGPIRVVAGAEAESDVSVGPSGRLHVRISGIAAPTWFSIRQGDACVDFNTLADPFEFTSNPVPPGAVVVELKRHDATIGSLPATVLAGETVDVVFD